MFEHRPHDAEGEFLRALTEKPAFATVHVRMALMCATLGHLDRALELVTQGYKADPLLPTLPPAEVRPRVAGRARQAVEIGRKAVELHPYLQISRANYAQALEFSGCLEEALEQYQLGSIMSRRPAVDARARRHLPRQARSDAQRLTRSSTTRASP